MKTCVRVGQEGPGQLVGGGETLGPTGSASFTSYNQRAFPEYLVWPGIRLLALQTSSVNPYEALWARRVSPPRLMGERRHSEG